jgi:hypothetical protein
MIFLLFLWWLFGFSCFARILWVEENQLTLGDMFLCAIIGLMGPVAFLYMLAFPKSFPMLDIVLFRRKE